MKTELVQLENQFLSIRNEIKKVKNKKVLDTDKLNKLLEERKQIKKALSNLRYEIWKKKQREKYVKHHTHNPYRIEGDVAILTTTQKNPVEFKIDVQDLDIVLKNKWHNHSYYNLSNYIVSRYIGEDGKYKIESLLHRLGYDRRYTFRNGNPLDLRRENICMKRYIVESFANKEE